MWKAAVEALKRSGKARFVGSSCHDARHADHLQAAAEGGFLDAVKYALWLNRDSPTNRALDACHERGIGLISRNKSPASATGPRSPDGCRRSRNSG